MRDAITGLVRGYADLDRYQQLIQRNRSILARVLPKIDAGRTDLILFHEGNIPLEQQRYINLQSQAEFRFVDVRRTAPATGFDPRRERANEVHEMRGFSAGYRHMCHFWFVDFIDYLEGYRFVARIDEDCTILAFPDLFRGMADDGVVFKSGGVLIDVPEAVIGMNAFSRFFRASRREPPICVPEHQAGPMTNLMALDLAYFRAHLAFGAFRRAVSASGMIYSHRWGDLPLWGEFLALYVDPQRARQESSDIRYFHGSHGALINPPPGEPDWLQTLNNVAAGKSARASSALAGWAGTPSAAVSGRPTGMFAFHTDCGTEPFWEVDLAALYPVRAIRIVNRGDACQERAIGLLVEVSRDGELFVLLHTQIEPFGGMHDGVPALLDFRMASQRPEFRFLRLRLPRRDYLHLDQVEVYV